MTETTKGSGAPKKAASKTAKSKTASKKKPATAASANSTSSKEGFKVKTGPIPGAPEEITLPLDRVLDATNRVGAFVSPLAEKAGVEAKLAALRGKAEKIDVSGLKVLGERAEKIQTDLTRVLESQSARAQELIGQARSQISALRP